MIQNGGCQTPWAARWARLSLNAPKPTSWAHYARPKSDCWATGKVTTTCSSKISSQELDLETFGWNPAGVLLVSFYHLQSYIPFKKVQRLRPVLQPFVSMCKSASRSRIFQPLYLRPVPVAHDFSHHCWAKLYITSPVPMAQWVARCDLKRNHTGVDGDHHRDMGEITKFMIWCNVYMCFYYIYVNVYIYISLMQYVCLHIYIRIHILVAISNAEVYKNVTLETHIICSSKLQVQFFLRPKELTSLQSAILIIYKFPSSKTLDERRAGLIFGRTATHDG